MANKKIIRILSSTVILALLANSLAACDKGGNDSAAYHLETTIYGQGETKDTVNPDVSEPNQSIAQGALIPDTTSETSATEATGTPTPSPTPTPTPTPTPVPKITISKKLKEGDKVKLGNYQGEINWIVWKKNGKNALLVSEKILDYRKFGDVADWETSEIREWLNSYFYDVAFTEAEKKVIKKENGDFITMLTNEDYYRIVDWNDSYAKTMKKYLAAKATVYATDQGAWPWVVRNEGIEVNYDATRSYMLRSNSNEWKTKEHMIDHLGDLASFYVCHDSVTGGEPAPYNGVRPAIWVKIG